jgi:hypothetical protein
MYCPDRLLTELLQIFVSLILNVLNSEHCMLHGNILFNPPAAETDTSYSFQTLKEKFPCTVYLISVGHQQTKLIRMNSVLSWFYNNVLQSHNLTFKHVLPVVKLLFKITGMEDNLLNIDFKNMEWGERSVGWKSASPRCLYFLHVVSMKTCDTACNSAVL